MSVPGCIPRAGPKFATRRNFGLARSRMCSSPKRLQLLPAKGEHRNEGKDQPVEEEPQHIVTPLTRVDF